VPWSEFPIVPSYPHYPHSTPTVLASILSYLLSEMRDNRLRALGPRLTRCRGPRHIARSRDLCESTWGDPCEITYSALDTEFPYLVGPTHPCTIAVHMEPFSTSGWLSSWHPRRTLAASCVSCRVFSGLGRRGRRGVSGLSHRRWRSNPSGKCSQERLTRGTITSTMHRAAHLSGCARCGAGAGCSAIKYQFLRSFPWSRGEGSGDRAGL